MPKMPISPKKMVSTVGEIRDAVGNGGGAIRVFGYERETLESIRSALASGAHDGAVDAVVELNQLAPGSGALPPFDLDSTSVVVLAAPTRELSSQGIEDALAEIGRTDVPAVLVLTEAPGIEMAFPSAGIVPKRVVGIAPDGTTPADVLAEAIVDASGEASIPLAASLPSLREKACAQEIRRTARQNSVIGALFIIPGADMPVMTMNEAKMVLRIAAAHGEELGAERAIELLGVVGSGFGLRAIARQALALLPGPGWIIKSGVAYGGTKAMGRAANSYFNSPTRVTPSRLADLANKIKEMRG